MAQLFTGGMSGSSSGRGQKWVNGLPRRSVGYSRQRISRLSSSLAPTMNAAMNGPLAFSRTARSSGMPALPGRNQSGSLSLIARAIAAGKSGQAIMGSLTCSGTATSDSPATVMRSASRAASIGAGSSAATSRSLKASGSIGTPYWSSSLPGSSPMESCAARTVKGAGIVMPKPSGGDSSAAARPGTSGATDPASNNCSEANSWFSVMVSAANPSGWSERLPTAGPSRAVIAPAWSVKPLASAAGATAASVRSMPVVCRVSAACSAPSTRAANGSVSMPWTVGESVGLVTRGAGSGGSSAPLSARRVRRSPSCSPSVEERRAIGPRRRSRRWKAVPARAFGAGLTATSVRSGSPLSVRSRSPIGAVTAISSPGERVCR